ncbi:MAG: hypothetical protein EXQ69_08165 [Acidimicrobiia bacterium]|nr:hypothetical protein [Acidimicrobiia bacterium]
MAAKQRRLDRVLESTYLDGVDGRSLDDIRAMRDECVEIETEVSYVRRLAHARIGILEAEIDRRKSGRSLSDLIDDLPRILADQGTRPPPANTRVQGSLAPSMSIQWNRGLEGLIADSTLANLPTLSDEELTQRIAQLHELDSEVSGKRKTLHGVIDALDRVLAARIASGTN